LEYHHTKSIGTTFGGLGVCAAGATFWHNT
jgi:hypothetical protein